MVESPLAFGGRVSEDGVAQSITLVHWLSPLCLVPYLIYPLVSRRRGVVGGLVRFPGLPGRTVASLIPPLS